MTYEEVRFDWLEKQTYLVFYVLLYEDAYIFIKLVQILFIVILRLFCTSEYLCAGYKLVIDSNRESKPNS